VYLPGRVVFQRFPPAQEKGIEGSDNEASDAASSGVGSKLPLFSGEGVRLSVIIFDVKRSEKIRWGFRRYLIALDPV
jgi:hypothetical protein